MKKFARILASSALKTALFSLAVTAAIVSVLGSSSTIKDALGQPGVYDKFIEGALEQTERQGEAPTQGKEISVNVLRDAVKQSVTPQVLRTTVENVSDSVYRWLDGESEQPDFRIDLTAQKQQFISAVGVAAEKHVSSLPVCTPAQAASIGQEPDIFELTCRPSSFSAAAARAMAEQQLSGDGKFLNNPVITADSLGKDESGQSFFQKTREAPKAFRLARSLPLILAFLAVVLAGVVFLLNDTRRQGIKSIAVTLLGSGIFLLLTTWLLSFILDRAAGPGGFLANRANNEFQAAILTVVRSLNGVFNKTVLVYGLLYIAVGAAILLAVRFLWGQGPTQVSKNEEEPQAAATAPLQSDKKPQTSTTAPEPTTAPPLKKPSSKEKDS